MGGVGNQKKTLILVMTNEPFGKRQALEATPIKPRRSAFFLYRDQNLIRLPLWTTWEAERAKIKSIVVVLDY